MKSPKYRMGLWVALGLLLSGYVLATNDSTRLSGSAPTISGAVKSYYPDQNTAPAISSTPSYYDNLPHCPGDPTSSTSNGINPLCPDINGIWNARISASNETVIPGDSSTKSSLILNRYCPDVCQTSRSETTVSGTTPTGASYTRVVGFTPAVCPPGYVQVSSRNPKNDIQYSATMSAPVTVTDQATYNTYLSQGYTCGPSVFHAWTYCSYEKYNVAVTASTNDCSTSSIGKTGTYTDGTSGTSYFGILQTCPDKNSTAGDVECRANGISACKYYASCSVAHATRFTNTFAEVECYIPPGYFYTSDKIPSTLVCARVKSVWQKRF